MLVVKGVHGGERAMPSSFSMSAAAFGKTAMVISLDGSSLPRTGEGAAPNCEWRPLAAFPT
jgi:hypothetical protein